jgi:hypothetical protein
MTQFFADVSKIPLLGDAIAMAGTLCFAFSNVGEVVKSHSIISSIANSNVNINYHAL